MSTFSVASLKYLEPSTLKHWITTGQSGLGSKFLVIDVRDSDFIGGHIKDCLHIPSTEVAFEAPKILKDALANGQNEIIFHCALSQQRGPSSAMRFMRFLNEVIESPSNFSEDYDADKVKQLRVWVLRGGFTKWQELYGTDTSLTEDYQKDIWQF